MISPRTGLVDKIYKLLAQFGPMTRSEIETNLKEPKRYVSPALSRLIKNVPTFGRRVYIVDYVYDSEVGRRYPRARYAIGNAENAPKPKPDKKAISRRYEQSRLAKFRNNSVFNLGKSRDKIREELRAS